LIRFADSVDERDRRFTESLESSIKEGRRGSAQVQ